MKTKTITLYEFNELSDTAKEKAREWYRSGALDYDWWDSTYEDAENIGLKIGSFGLDRYRNAEGEFLTGAEECARKIIKDHGSACETFKTAESYLVKLSNIPHDADTGECLDCESLDDLNAEFLKSLLEDYSIILQKEYEFLLSDESVDDMIAANGYTFTEDGKREN